MYTSSKWVQLAGRIGLGVILLVSGFGKLANWTGTVAFAASRGVCYELRRLSPSDAACAPEAPPARSSAEAELDALTAPSQSPALAAGSYASTWDEPGGVVPGAEAELHALLAWQDDGDRARPARTSPPAAASQHARSASSQGTGALAAGAHDDAGVSAPSLPPSSPPNADHAAAQRAAAPDAHAAASDDCSCS